MRTKKNVEKFSEDILHGGSYVYTSEKTSSKLANQRLSQAVREIYPVNGKKILDLGCGDGTYSIEFAQQGAEVLGIDPSEQAVASASKKIADSSFRKKISFEMGNIYELSIGENAYDCTVLRGVLHHLPDQANAFLAIAPFSKSLLVIEPNGTNPVLKIIEKSSRYHIEHEEQSFSLSQIASWMEDAGFSVTKAQYVNFVPFFCPDWMARICKFFEPFVEKLPGIRALCCGQVIILAHRKAQACSI